MSVNIEVYSLARIEAQDPCAVPHLIVSINAPGYPAARVATNGATLGRIDLYFWDLDRLPDPGLILQSGDPELSDLKEEDLFQPADAAQVVDMVMTYPDVECIRVHCRAGQSRSAGMAAALHKALNGDDSVIFRDRRYTPNMRVYRMVLDEWYKRHPIG